jgi:hypothetical protein
MGWLKIFTVLGWACWLLALLAGAGLAWMMAHLFVTWMS